MSKDQFRTYPKDNSMMTAPNNHYEDTPNKNPINSFKMTKTAMDFGNNKIISINKMTNKQTIYGYNKVQKERNDSI